jgi:hypothetical protein
VLLPTYAVHIPADYGEQITAAGDPNYGCGGGGVEIWGRPRDVVAAVCQHNAATRRLAAEYDHVFLVDLDKSMPRDARHFNDVCHLTQIGCERWVDDAIAGLRPWLASRFDLDGNVLQAASGRENLK